MKTRTIVVFILAASAVVLLILVDFLSPGESFQVGLRDLAESMDHPGAGPRRTSADILHSAGFLASYAGSVLLLYAFPARIGLIANRVSSGSILVRLFLTGLAVSSALIGVIILSIFTPITFPLSVLSGLILFAGTYLGSVSILYRLANELFNWAGWKASPVLAVGYGLLVFSALSSIPYAGWVFWVLMWLAGSGAAFRSRFGSGNKWTLRPLFEELKK